MKMCFFVKTTPKTQWTMKKQNQHKGFKRHFSIWVVLCILGVHLIKNLPFQPLSPLLAYAATANDLSVGDSITMNNVSFKVVQKQNNELMMVADKLIEKRVFDIDADGGETNDTKSNQWGKNGSSGRYRIDNSDLRNWLNGAYYDAFSPSEKAAIILKEHTVGNRQNKVTFTDKIRLLREEEINDLNISAPSINQGISAYWLLEPTTQESSQNNQDLAWVNIKVIGNVDISTINPEVGNLLGVRPVLFIKSDTPLTQENGVYRVDHSAVSSTNNLPIGSFVQMGAYQGKMILWRVIANEEGKPILWSEHILSLKAFDAKDTREVSQILSAWGLASGEDTQNWANQRKENGSQYYIESTLRKWLNGEGEVNWDIKKPNPESVVFPVAQYANEDGFLSAFSTIEKVAIAERTNKVPLSKVEYTRENPNGKPLYQHGDSLSKGTDNEGEAFAKDVTDKVFLLSRGEIYQFVYQNWLPTIKYPNNNEMIRSLKQESTFPDEAFSWRYWTRSPFMTNRANASKVQVVESDGDTISSASAYNSAFGVVPAMRLNANVSLTGTGTKTNPYRIDGQNRGIAPSIPGSFTKIQMENSDISQEITEALFLKPGTYKVFWKASESWGNGEGKKYEFSYTVDGQNWTTYETDTNVYTITLPAQNTTRGAFRVKAKTSYGNESLYSSLRESAVFSLDATNPQLTVNKIEATSETIHIEASVSDSGSVVSGVFPNNAYRYGLKKEGEETLWSGWKGNTHSFINLPPNTTYTVYVQGRDIAGNVTETVYSKTTKALKPIVSLSFVENSSPQRILISIQSNNPDDTAFKVERSTSEGFQNSTVINSNGAPFSTNKTREDAPGSGVHYYRAIAKNKNNEETIGDISRLSVANTKLQAPEEVLLSDLTYGQNGSLTFNAVLSATAYEIQVQRDGATWEVYTHLPNNAIPNVNQSSLVVGISSEELSNKGNTRKFRVKAKANAFTDSDWMESNVKTIQSPLLEIRSVETPYYGKGITITWTRVEGAKQGYEVQMRRNNGVWIVLNERVNQPDSGAEVRFYVQKREFESGGTRQFRVRTRAIKNTSTAEANRASGEWVETQNLTVQKQEDVVSIYLKTKIEEDAKSENPLGLYDTLNAAIILEDFTIKMANMGFLETVKEDQDSPQMFKDLVVAYQNGQIGENLGKLNRMLFDYKYGNHINSKFGEAFYEEVQDPDKEVFILSLEEIEAYLRPQMKPLEEGGLGWGNEVILKSPTQDAYQHLINLSRGVWNPPALIKEGVLGPWKYWIRTPRADTPEYVQIVSEKAQLEEYAAFVGITGVVPAVTLNTGKFLVSDGTGAVETPYYLKFSRVQ